MIDMHSHILPNIDDGAQSIDESIEMIKEAYKSGFTGIISTSHYIEESYCASAQKREELIQELNKRLEKENINMTIYNGAEAYICNNLKELVNEGYLPTINKTKYLLIELPMNNEIIYLNELLYNLMSNGIIPIIAHPERYSYIQKNPKQLLELKNEGVLFQANYGSIVGDYGKEAKKTLKKLLKKDLITFLGTDSHSNRIYHKMDIILKKVKKIIGEEKLNILSNINPERILKNENVEIL